MSLEVAQFPLELEYKKHSNIVPADIARLRAWLRTQPHMPEKYITDLDLILAYHCSNHSMEVTKQLLDLYYTFKTHSVLFKDTPLNNTLDQMKTLLILPLKTRAHDGSAVLYTKLLDSDIKKFNYYDCIRTLILVMSLWQLEEGTWPGLHLVIDMKDVTVAHLSKMDIVYMQQLFFYLQEGILLKLKKIHFINAPSFMDKVLFLIKPFLKAQLLQDIHIHTNGLKTLEAHVPVAALPVETGGQDGSLVDFKDHMIKKIKDNENVFVSEQKKRINENLRPGKPKTITDIFGGVEGSFKKLDID